ncbi:unnamed protein product [Urochloa humidicola]
MSRAVAGPILREDVRGIPRSLPLLAALVEAEARSCAAASRPADSGLVRAFRCCCCADAAESALVRSFRGGAAPKVSIRIFLGRIHQLTKIDGNCFVLAGIYLTRFIHSAAAREAGILVEPATAHRLVAVSVLLGAKFGGHSPVKWTWVFEDSSEGAIRAGEMADLEGLFLRAIDFRLFVDRAGFDSFCKVLRGPWAPSAEGGCASKKRQAEAVAGEEGERERLVPARRARQTWWPEWKTSTAARRLLLPAVLSN